MVTIVVIGCGRIGRMHAADIAGHDRLRLAAVFHNLRLLAGAAKTTVDRVRRLLSDNMVADRTAAGDD